MNSITHKVDDREYLLIPIPEDADIFNTHTVPSVYVYYYITDVYYYITDGVEGQPLPPGNWSIIGRASDLTESQCSEIVERNPSGTYIGYDLPFGCSTAKESLATLLSVNGLEETTLILQKQ